jgi:hypothetical protein
MRIFTCAVVVAAALLVPATVAATPRVAGTTCAGFRVVRVVGDVVYSNKVVQLRTTRVTCKTARAIARKIATDLLLSKPVPARISGFRIKIVKPCSGCAPRWQVTASGTSGSFKFVILGGA